jgi:hypothetical protein
MRNGSLGPQDSRVDQAQIAPQAASVLSPLPSKLSTTTNADGDASPAIPGLFLTGSAPVIPAASTSVPALIPAEPVRKKRPRASELYGDPLPSATPPKRPFGKGRIDQPLVIDVSEDEASDRDNDSDASMSMDLDTRHKQPQEASQPRSQNLPLSSGQLPGRSLPPLPDFPRVPFTGNGASPSVSAVNTPPAVSNENVKFSASDVLRRKQEEIDMMQKRIAQLEQRKAKQNMSRAHTPASLVSMSAPTQPETQMQARPPKQLSTSLSADSNQTATTAGDSIENTNQPIRKDTPKLAIPKSIESQSLDGPNKADVEWKRKRRSEIENGLPLVNAEVERGKTKIEELRAEMAKWEAAVREGEEGKRKLLEEMESLDLNTDEHPQGQDKQLRAPKDDASSDTGRFSLLIPSTSSSKNFFAVTRRSSTYYSFHARSCRDE